MLDTTIQVKTDQFDGPLSLLLLFIKKEEVNIADVNLTDITEQYLDYLGGMKEIDFGVAGDYLYLASTLLFLKSKTAVSLDERKAIEELPESEILGGIQDHAELIRRLEELACFQKMGRKLWELPRAGEVVFTRPRANRKEVLSRMSFPMDLERLLTAMMNVIQREKKQYTISMDSAQTVREKLIFLKDTLKEGMETNFKFLARGGESELKDILITFISLLELVRLKKVEMIQQEDCGEIHIKVLSGLDDIEENVRMIQ